MNLLLDSNILLWYDRGDERLPAFVVEQIRNPQSRVLVSALTIWELSIKRSLGKLPGTGSIAQMVLRNGFGTLPISPEHAEAIVDLPRHHSDPFDRLLIAQAIHERLTLVAHDRSMSRYSVSMLTV